MTGSLQVLRQRTGAGWRGARALRRREPWHRAWRCMRWCSPTPAPLLYCGPGGKSLPFYLGPAILVCDLLPGLTPAACCAGSACFLR